MADLCSLSPLGWRSVWEIAAPAGRSPEELDAIARASGGTVFAPAPDRRLILAERGAFAIGDAEGRVTDLSDHWRLLSISGTGARELLARGMEIDISPSGLPTGTACQTLCAGVPVIVHAAEDLRIDLLIASSFAPWLAEWLAVSRSILFGETSHAAG